MRMQFLKESDVSRPLGIPAHENDEQRCRVDGAVIWRMRNFIHPGEFADTEFVENFPRLLVTPIVHFVPLVSREEPQGIGCRLGPICQGLE